MAEVKVRIEAVRVDGRYRRDLGDIDGLAESIHRDGLIHAIAVTPDMRLLAGERRLAAARKLGWQEIDARVVETIEDAAARLRVERDENTCRKEMTVSERVALARALEEIEAPRAAQRRYEARSRAGKIRQGKLDKSVSCSGEQDTGNTRDIAGQAVGLPSSTLVKAKKVVEAAADESLPPAERAIARAALVDMDATGNVTGNYEKVRGARSALTGPPTVAAIRTPARQRRAISAACTTLSGVCHGLKQITELNPDIDAAEAAEWVDDLSESRRVIESLIKKLKERTK